MSKSAVQLASPRRGRVKRQGLVEEVYNLIRADIMSLKIPPDTRILVDNLVRDLGVSHTPIREALSMLEGVGLVEKKHFVGYCTAPTLNRKQFDELFEMRLLIEPAAARYAAERMSEDELAELARHAEAMDADVSRISYDQFADQDSELHRRIAAGSGNILIAQSLSRLHTHMHIFRLRFHTEIAADAVNEHDVVIQSLMRRDPEAAGAAMHDHIRRSYNRLVQFAAG
jgi:DNA-binding GntR family transcriptional regulator